MGERLGVLAGELEDGWRGLLDFLVSFFSGGETRVTREEVTFPRSQRVVWKHIWDQEQESDCQS